ncbi:TRAP transporter small permease [Polymorphobacter sp.]|uniref:TRAP transporter small permease n=1 Tax=Polymorphobacter sp. TaxID=1909290 RepID=UPI003F6F0A01
MSLPSDNRKAGDDPVKASKAERIPMIVGAVALTGALGVDAVAVAGRHIGINLLGSIEVVQMCMVVAATSAIVLATISASHARVQILLERLSRTAARRFDRLADFASALAFLWLVIGSAWLLVETWTGSEMTELLNIPLRWIRLVWIGGAALTAVLFLRMALRKVDG